MVRKGCAMTDEEKELVRILTEQSNKNISLINNQNEALAKSEEHLLEMYRKCNKINLWVFGMSLLICTVIICFFIFSYFFSDCISRKYTDIQNKGYLEEVEEVEDE